MKKLLFIALLFCLPAFGQVTVSPFVSSGVQFLNNSGQPLSGGKVCFFAAGSTTPQTAYSDNLGTVPLSNPAVLDSAGRANIFLTAQSYKIVIAASTASSQCVPALSTSDNVSWATMANTVTSLVDTGALTVQASAAATSGANQSSPLLCVQGNYWTGAASASDKWCLQDLLGTGSNPTTTLNVTHGAGSSGTAGLNLASALTVTGPSTLSSVTATTVNASSGLTSGLRERDCRVDGTLDVTGVADSSTTINTCIANAVTNNQAIISLPCGQLKINTALNLTNRPSLTLQGCGSNASGFAAPNSNMTTLNCNTAGVCVDLTGSSHMTMREISIRLANTYATPSTVAIMEGRDDALGGGNGAYCFSQFNKFYHVDILTDFNAALNGGRGYIGIYNIGAEHQVYESMKINAGTPMFFATTNVLALSSPYQTLLGACPQSMTIVDFTDISLTNNGSNGIEAWTTAGFRFHGTVEVDFTANDLNLFVNAIAANGSYMIGWDGYLHVENMVANNAVLSIGATVTDKNNLTAFVGGSTGAGKYINFANNGMTATDNIFKINTQNEGTPRNFIGNAASTIKGGELWIGTTASPQSSTVTLTGTNVYAQGFTDGNVSFNAASQYELISDSGISERQPAKYTGQITSTLATGTAPLVIASTTPVANLTVQNCSTCVLTGTPTGTGIQTATLKKGTGAGNYTSASTTYVVVDATNLCYTVTIPTGWKLVAQASANIGSLTAVVNVAAAMTDNAACSTANAGILTEASVFGPSIGNGSQFSLSWVINGDGAAHNVALQFKTTNGADSVTLGNASATFIPTMTFLLTPSN